MRSWARHLTLKTPLFGYSKVYKCGPAKLMLVGNAVMDKYPIQGEMYFLSLYSAETEVMSGLNADHLYPLSVLHA